MSCHIEAHGVSNACEHAALSSLESQENNRLLATHSLVRVHSSTIPLQRISPLGNTPVLFTTMATAGSTGSHSTAEDFGKAAEGKEALRVCCTLLAQYSTRRGKGRTPSANCVLLLSASSVFQQTRPHPILAISIPGVELMLCSVLSYKTKTTG
jgi:hypothetical protein